MLTRSYLAKASFRPFSTSVKLNAPKNKKEIEAKKAADRRIERRIAQRKIEAKKPASSSELFMTIPEALRYLRASEVGRPSDEAAITVQTRVLSDRGVAPLQGSVRLPRALKETRILCISNDEAKRAESLSAGAAHVGDSSIIDEILQGKVNLDFDRILATPDVEPLLKKVARILGPRGLMPNAKKGTVTEDIVGVVSNTLGTQPFKEKNSNVSLTVARCEFSDADVIKNIQATSKAIHDSVKSTKSKKPILLGHTVLSSTHGPGIVVNF